MKTTTAFSILFMAGCGVTPSGTGQRMCIGAHLATMSLQIALALLLREFAVEPVGAAVTPEAQVTLRPRGGLPLRLRAH